MGNNTRTNMAVLSIEVLSERETARGWAYDVEILWKGMGSTTHSITLSWVDHDALSGGSESPSAVVERVLHQRVGELGIEGIPEQIDVSTLLRRCIKTRRAGA